MCEHHHINGHFVECVPWDMRVVWLYFTLFGLYHFLLHSDVVVHIHGFTLLALLRSHHFVWKKRYQVQQRAASRRPRVQSKWFTVIVHLTHWPLEDLTIICEVSFQTYSSEKWLRWLLWNCSQMTATEPQKRNVNIGSGNGLVPSGSKPLPEPMLK